MPPTPDFLHVVERLRAGDQAAAAEVFDRFARRLIDLAAAQLDRRARQQVDPEDIIQSVYRSFFTRFREGQFEPVSWDSLWGLLTRITLRKCANRMAYLRADRRDIQRQVSLETGGAPAGPPSDEPTPLEGILLTETLDEVMHGLDERERTMLSLSLQGYSVQEIGPRVGRTQRTVQRLLKHVRQQLEAMQADQA